MYSELDYHGKIAPIHNVQFCIMSPKEIVERSVVEVTTPDTYNGNNPVPEGLFDIRMGVLDSGKYCQTDKLDNVFCPGYFGHINLALPVFYHHFIPYILQILGNICFKCGSLLINREQEEHLFSKKKGSKRFADVTEYIKNHRKDNSLCPRCKAKQPNKYTKEEVAKIYATWSEVGNTYPVSKALITPEHVLSLFKRLSDEDVEFMGFNREFCRPEWMVCTVLPVCPPSVRPSVKQDNSQRMEDDLTHKYVDILKHNKSIKTRLGKLQGTTDSTKYLEDARSVLQYHVATLMDNEIQNISPATQRTGRVLKSIRQRLKSKDGRIRNNLMGKRVNFSGRTVITPDPIIGIDQIGVPEMMCKELTFPEKVTRFNYHRLQKMILNGPEKYPGAKNIKKKGGQTITLKHAILHKYANELRIGDVVERHLLDDDYVLFNRQPSLHKMSMMGHRVKKISYNTFRPNPNIVTPYNADFDGDEMNLHVPQSYQAANELRCLAAVPKQLISGAKHKPVAGVVQDTLVGAYILTQDQKAFNRREMMNLQMWNPKAKLVEDKAFFSGHDIMSTILPPVNILMPNKSFDEEKDDRNNSPNYIKIENGVMTQGILDKDVFMKATQGLVQVAFNDFGPTEAKDVIDNTCHMVTNYLLHKGFSVGIGDLMIDEEVYQSIENEIKENKQKVEKLIQELHLNIFENLTGKSNSDEFEGQVFNILKNTVGSSGKIAYNKLSSENRLLKMIQSGSKGQNINVHQMVACLGQQAVDGKRVPYGFTDRTLPHYHRFDDSPEARGFVESSFIKGLTPQEFYTHAMGGREGLIDTAVKTSDTGYIQRKLVKALEDACVQYDKTVRDSSGQIIQFLYGEDGMDACKIETQKVHLLENLIIKKDDKTGIDKSGSVSNLMKKYKFSQDEQYQLYMTAAAMKRMTPSDQEVLDQHFEEHILQVYYEYVRDVCKMSPSNVVNYPVYFDRLILNTKQHFKIHKGQLSDLTPKEALDKITSKFSSIKINPLIDGLFIFKMLYYSNLSPKRIIFYHRLTAAALDYLLDEVMSAFYKSYVEPGEMVGTLAAQSIGEPATQMTLNTFHFAGVGEKSNVTRGVPRLRELLHVTKNPKNPSLTIHLKDEYSNDKDKITSIMNILELTRLRDITLNVAIYYDPNEHNVSDGDRKIMEFFGHFENEMDIEHSDSSKWVLRIELNKKTMLDKQLLMEDVYYAIYSMYSNDLICTYSDDNADQLVFRIKVNNLMNGDSGNVKCDENAAYDDFCLLKMLEKSLLDKVILRGIPGMNKIMIHELKTEGRFDIEGNFVLQDKWVLDTDGVNNIKTLQKALIQPCVDFTKTISNDINEVFAVLGIEATRNVLIKEIKDVIKGANDYVNVRHINLLADAMTCRGALMSVDRHGINRGDIGPLAKCSFEETDQQLYKAAVFGEVDNVTGVSSNIMLGQVAPCGTGKVDILFDEVEFEQFFVDAQWRDQFRKWSMHDTVLTDQDEAFLEENGEEDDCGMSNFEFSFNPHLNTVVS